MLSSGLDCSEDLFQQRFLCLHSSSSSPPAPWESTMDRNVASIKYTCGANSSPLSELLILDSGLVSTSIWTCVLVAQRECYFSMLFDTASLMEFLTDRSGIWNLSYAYLPDHNISGKQQHIQDGPLFREKRLVEQQQKPLDRRDGSIIICDITISRGSSDVYYDMCVCWLMGREKLHVVISHMGYRQEVTSTI